MTAKLDSDERRVYDYLQRIAPQWASNADILQATGISSHQQVFMITRDLMGRKRIQGAQGRRGRQNEWAFSALPLSTPANTPRPVMGLEKDLVEEEYSENSAVAFEHLAEQVMSRHFGAPLRKGTLAGVPKIFDLVSKDGRIVGDAKYYTLVGGERLPPAKFSVIAEHVWLLEKTQSARRFLVFGHQREVPVQWLKKYGHMVTNVEFYFLTDEGKLEKLN